jgi:hypothetical protein
MKRFGLPFALFFLALPVPCANTKSEIVLTGKPHMEFDCPANLPLHLNIRSGEILIAGADNQKITVDLAGKNANKFQDMKGRLSVDKHVAQLDLTGGPRNELEIIIHVPRNSDLTARIFAGEVNVEDVIGNKDLELHAGELNINVGDVEDYGRVDVSVGIGQVDTEAFGPDSKAGFFRTVSRDGAGKYSLRAHVGTGQLSVR